MMTNKEYLEAEYRTAMYANLMNLLDTFAQYGKPLDDTWRIAMNMLAAETLTDGENESVKECIASVADANDCGYCTTWDEVVIQLRINMLTGERIHFNKITREKEKIDVYDWITGAKLEPIQRGE